MVNGISVALNVVSVMSPPPALCNLSSRMVVKLCIFGVCFRGVLSFMNCDDICMCVVNNQFMLMYCWVCVLVGVGSHVDVLGLPVRLSW